MLTTDYVCQKAANRKHTLLLPNC